MNKLYLRDKGRDTTDADIGAAVAEAHRMYRPKEFSPGRHRRLVNSALPPQTHPNKECR